MSRQNRQSEGIYESQRRKPVKYVEQDSIAGKRDGVGRKSTVYYLLILAFIFILGVVLLAVKHSEVRGAVEDSADAVVVVGAQRPFNTGQVATVAPVSNPSVSFVIHELVGFAPVETKPEQGVALDINRLQQAAWHLYQAERFYRWKDWSAALREYRNAEIIFPDLPGLHERIGMCHFWIEDYEHAADAFRRAVLVNPEFPGLFNNLGLVYLFQENYEKAEEALQAAVRMDADYSAAHLNMGLVLFHQDKMNRAANAFREFLRLEPNDAEGVHYFSLALMRAERWGEAEIVLRSAVTMMPNIAALHFRLAEVQCRKGENDLAVASIEAGIRLIDAKSALTWLSQGNYDPLRSRTDYQGLVIKLTDLL